MALMSLFVHPKKHEKKNSCLQMKILIRGTNFPEFMVPGNKKMGPCKMPLINGVSKFRAVFAAFCGFAVAFGFNFLVTKITYEMDEESKNDEDDERMEAYENYLNMSDI